MQEGKRSELWLASARGRTTIRSPANGSCHVGVGTSPSPSPAQAQLTNVDIALLDDDHGAVDLVDDVVNELAGGSAKRVQIADVIVPRARLLCSSRAAPMHTKQVTYRGKASESISSPVIMSSYTSILAWTFGVGGVD